MGEKEFETFVYDNAIEAGNKVIANVGTIKFYGKPRTKTLTRLFKEAQKGSKEITVEKGLDLVKGDRLALMTTSQYALGSEDRFVETYNNETGLVTLDKELKYYHWGASESTATLYNGVDIRGEVMLLTRNIVIKSSNSW